MSCSRSRQQDGVPTLNPQFPTLDTIIEFVESGRTVEVPHPTIEQLIAAEEEKERLRKIEQLHKRRMTNE